MRFSIRDILWLTVVVAIAVAWWLSMPRTNVRARVSGTITAAGKPLSQGHVILYSKDGSIVGAKVVAGKYNIPSMPPGKYTATVIGSGVSARYADALLSGMQFNVREGTPMTFNVDLPELP